MSCSASSTDWRPRGRPLAPAEPPPARRALALGLALLLAVGPAGLAQAGEEFPDADTVTLRTPGTVDNTRPGETRIDSFVDQGRADWTGLDQPADNALHFEQPSAGSTFWNVVGGEFGAHLNGQVSSNGNVVFSSPFGVFLGSEAVVDVGGLVAVGSDLSDFAAGDVGLPTLPLSGDVTIGAGAVVAADRDVLLYGRHVTNEGSIHAEAGQLLMLGGEQLLLDPAEALTRSLLSGSGFVARLGEGTVTNTGRLTAPEARLVGRRVANHGEIRIDDGALLMLGADAVYLRAIDDPVIVRLPHGAGASQESGSAASQESQAGAGVGYAVENTGRIDAGRGHVRLAAADPLGWGIRQAASSGDDDTASDAPSIAAGRIELDGGDDGHVSVSGLLDTRDRGAADDDGTQLGGAIDVTGDVIAIADARLDASGRDGGGRIRVGGEQQGGGTLQRARAVVVDAASSLTADALEAGDGGRVIVFAETLTAVDGALSARGGEAGGDGGFVETSGLEHLRIERTPDLSAPAGEAGDWLIDPYAIRIVADAVAADCAGAGQACLNRAVEAILAPNFDDAAFDDVLRTVGDQPGLPSGDQNTLSVDLLERALAVGTNVTLSTEAFDGLGNDPAEGDGTKGGAGDITFEAPLSIDDAETLPGTRASLTLLAAGSIYLDQDILVGSAGAKSDLALSITLRANDQDQRPASLAFGTDRLRGAAVIAGNVRTGGGDFIASGLSVLQASGSTISTGGGDIELSSGSLGAFQTPSAFGRGASDVPFDTSVDARIDIAGTLDTSRSADDPGAGGDVTLSATGLIVQTALAGFDLLQIDTGTLSLTGAITSGGGDVTLSAGSEGSTFAGDVEIRGGLVDSDGGDVTIQAHRVDAANVSGSFGVEFIDPAPSDPLDNGSEGGGIVIANAVGSTDGVRTRGGTLTLGSATTQRIDLVGDFDTTDPAPEGVEDGLLAIVARDASGLDLQSGRYGRSQVRIGVAEGSALVGADLDAAGISVDARSVTTENTVSLDASGTTTEVVLESEFGLDRDGDAFTDLDFVEQGTIRLRGGRRIDLGAGSALTAETIEIAAAWAPTELNGDESVGIAPLPTAEPRELTRLVFGGSGGDAAAAGVRLAGDDVTITVGDGTTASQDLAFVATDDAGEPTDFGLQRETRGDYAGLQLRSRDGSARPETITIEQDGRLVIADAAPTTDGELFFGERSGSGGTTGIFGSAAIGSEGLDVTLAAADGEIVVETARGLNSTASPPPDLEAGRSRVSLHGGLLLPVDETNVTPTANAVQIASLLAADDRFQVESLEITTPRDLRIGSFSAVTPGDRFDPAAIDASQTRAVAFVAGRDTGVAGLARDGTLTVEAGGTLASADRLSLHAGASGFGDLVFEAGTTTLQADDVALRAGAGVASQNGDAASVSRIVGLADAVAIRNAEGLSFQARTSDPEGLAFEVRQDAGWLGTSDLPDAADFGLGLGDTFALDAGAPAVHYRIQSDAGAVDLRGLAADRFEDAALALLGLQTTTSAAILVDPAFGFDGPRIELGGSGGFTLDETLAAAFDLAGTATSWERITLRAGADRTGSLGFSPGSAGSLTLAAPRIDLVAGDGVGGQTGSTIAPSGARFDLSSAAEGEATLVFEQDAAIGLADLPAATDFVVLPNVLALRSDDGAIELDGLDLTALPILLNGVAMGGGDLAARLILEADSIRLAAAADADLALTEDGDGDATNDLRNVRLRLRTNELVLEASAGDTGGTGRVLAPAAAAATGPQADAAFDDDPLLVEAFVRDGQGVTLTNLGAASAVAGTPGSFDLGAGRGPGELAIDQVESVSDADLPDHRVFAGHLARSLEDDANGDPLATRYRIESIDGGVTIAALDVDGSLLEIGSSFDPIEGDVALGAGSYDLESLAAFSRGTIRVESGVTMTARDTIQLEAALVEDPTDVANAFVPGNAMGGLTFCTEALATCTGASAPTTTLTANRILLTAGPDRTVTNPDGTTGAADGEADPIDDAELARLDLAGLASLGRAAQARPLASRVTLRQSAAFDTAASGVGRVIDDGATTDEWDTIELVSRQATLTVGELDRLGPNARGLELGALEADTTVVVELADPALGLGAAAGFEEVVAIESDDVLIRNIGSGELDLDAPNLRLISSTLLSSFPTASELGQLRSDPTALERPLVSIEQPVDFSGVALPRPDAYWRRTTDAAGIATDTRRASLAELDLQLTATGGDLVLGPAIREGASFGNLILRSTVGDVVFDFSATPNADRWTPGFGPGLYDFATPDLDETDFAALQLASLDVEPGPGGEIRVLSFGATPDGEDLTIRTDGEQRFGGLLALAETLASRGRELLFADDVYRDTSAPDLEAGLIAQATQRVTLAGDVGTSSDANASSPGALGRLWVLFDRDGGGVNPTLELGERTDDDGDGIAERPVASTQTLRTTGEIVVASVGLSAPENPLDDDDGDLLADLRAAISGAGSLQALADQLDAFGVGRQALSPYATIGKGAGDLSIVTGGGATANFVMGSGERLSVGGNLSIDTGAAAAVLGDVSAIDLVVSAGEIGLVRRNAGVTTEASGATAQDAGSVVMANTIDFGGVTPAVIGRGKQPRFGVVDPFDPTLPAFLGRFPLFANTASGRPLVAADFRFVGGPLARVPALTPRGASRSELTGAFGPVEVPIATPPPREAPPLRRAERLKELDVTARETPLRVQLDRLRGAAIIDDLGGPTDEGRVVVTAARLDASDAERAIELYESLFGPEGERAGEVRAVLQEALDAYLETTRARRVIGFELRRFVKNRPSTLLEAYQTLDRLDALFRYHRRLGLSPGEFRRIQRDWLDRIQPEGITLDELAEAIHPSRYVRGSDILDIFGR